VIRKIWKSKMTSATMSSATKSALRLLLEHETKRLGSKGLGLEEVARSVGASTSWITKYLRYEDRVGEPRAPLFDSIAKAYDQICNRFEQERDNERARLAAVRGQLHAATKSIYRVADRDSQSKAS
jgi:transcriptional regulator with XRE-family HTH domain